MKEWVKIHKPSIIELMETKARFNSTGMVFNKMNFTASIHIDPTGRRRGIWVIWDPVQVTLRAFEANDQVIHAKIKRESYLEWILSSVYASPNPVNRAFLWDNLEAMADNMIEPWMIAGDFNDIASSIEKMSVSTIQSQTNSRKFVVRMNRCNLMDLGCSSPHLTWSNGRQGLANTLEQHDQAVCNSEWRVSYPEGAVKNLPRTYSDHCLMVIYTQWTPSFVGGPFYHDVPAFFRGKLSSTNQ
ncbi:uncharacterized protein LOC114271254 [Camellia sinensis]|uniref:uncharacterized protein LOC114271254 n=1 Tax=Camellia sinensis TaxID=4442 RepID=UPI001036BD3E|nr:uncharacterized protein LOC114271254 [Camellia sinensis]